MFLYERVSWLFIHQGNFKSKGDGYREGRASIFTFLVFSAEQPGKDFAARVRQRNDNGKLYFDSSHNLSTVVYILYKQQKVSVNDAFVYKGLHVYVCKRTLSFLSLHQFIARCMLRVATSMSKDGTLCKCFLAPWQGQNF